MYSVSCSKDCGTFYNILGVINLLDFIFVYYMLYMSIVFIVLLHSCK